MRPSRSDLAGVFRVGFSNGDVGIFGRIWRFVNRERFGIRRHAEAVFAGNILGVHAILMPKFGKTEAADLCSLQSAVCSLQSRSSRPSKKEADPEGPAKVLRKIYECGDAPLPLGQGAPGEGVIPVELLLLP